MIADPIPDDPTFPHDAQRAIFQTDANRIDALFAFRLFELADRGALNCSGRDDMRAWHPVELRMLDVKTTARIGAWFATASKQIVQRQRLAPFVFLKGFPCHSTDHIVSLGKACLPSALVG